MQTHFIFLINFLYLINLSPIHAQNDPNLGKMILSQQKEDIVKNNGKIHSTNYWNIAVAYRNLEMSPDSIYHNLEMSMKDNPVNFSELVDLMVEYTTKDIMTCSFYKIMGDRFLELNKKAKHLATTMNTKEPVVTSIINQEVVDTLIAIMETDQRYRGNSNFFNDENLRKMQYTLDSLNAFKLRKLYNKYGYPGKSITGDNKYQNYFCLFVEHGQNQTGGQRFWLPIIANALKKGELSPSVFKMLLDRIHWLETGKQYFGSHNGIPLDSFENIDKVKKQYGI